MKTRAKSGIGIRGLTIYGILYLVFLYVPVLFLPLFSFNDSIHISFPLKGFTVKWYEHMFANAELLDAFVNSLKVAGSVSVISTVLGVMAARAFTRYRFRGQRPALGLLALPLVVPGIILGIALLIMSKWAGFQLSLITIAAAHVLIATPFATFVMISRLEGFDPNLEEASRDLGESGWTTFWRVTFPLALPGIVASLLLTFIESFDEFILAFFLSGDEATMPLYIWSQLRFPRNLPVVLALGACILAASIILVAFAEWVRRQGVSPTPKSENQ
ncbi:MAG: ABC transporter permease [Alphaproteobacteria bacterium]|nr:ABC transporter permease [Alphaproteobacteria bacterium]